MLWRGREEKRKSRYGSDSVSALSNVIITAKVLSKVCNKLGAAVGVELAVIVDDVAVIV